MLYYFNVISIDYANVLVRDITIYFYSATMGNSFKVKILNLLYHMSRISSFEEKQEEIAAS